jgi:hypothetical protein
MVLTNTAISVTGLEKSFKNVKVLKKSILLFEKAVFSPCWVPMVRAKPQ